MSTFIVITFINIKRCLK